MTRPCPSCDGTGQTAPYPTRAAQLAADDPYASSDDCRACDGTGERDVR